VEKYPAAIKAFYMKRDPKNRELALYPWTSKKMKFIRKWIEWLIKWS